MKSPETFKVYCIVAESLERAREVLQGLVPILQRQDNVYAYYPSADYFDKVDFPEIVSDFSCTDVKNLYQVLLWSHSAPVVIIDDTDSKEVADRYGYKRYNISYIKSSEVGPNSVS